MSLLTSAYHFYSDFASGDRERDGLLLGLRFLGLDASPFAGEAFGDLDLAGDLQKRSREATIFNIQNAGLTAYSKNLDALSSIAPTK